MREMHAAIEEEPLLEYLGYDLGQSTPAVLLESYIFRDTYSPGNYVMSASPAPCPFALRLPVPLLRPPLLLTAVAVHCAQALHSQHTGSLFSLKTSDR